MRWRADRRKSSLLTQDVGVSCVLSELANEMQIDPPQRQRPEPVTRAHVVQLQPRSRLRGRGTCAAIARADAVDRAK